MKSNPFQVLYLFYNYCFATNPSSPQNLGCPLASATIAEHFASISYSLAVAISAVVISPIIVATKSKIVDTAGINANYQ